LYSIDMINFENLLEVAKREKPVTRPNYEEIISDPDFRKLFEDSKVVMEKRGQEPLIIY